MGTLSASAATPACGQRCISIFSRALGSYAQPNFVEAVLGGVAKVGQPVILKRASSFDPSEDLIVATTAFQNRGLTLVNGSTRNFSRPLVMDYPRNAYPTDEPTPQIRVRRLKLLGKEHTVPDSQLRGTRFGVLT